mgnify:CR=1 FL=1
MSKNATITITCPLTRERKIEICAQGAHEINRVWCLAHGDYSALPWIEAPDWQKQSAKEGVRVALTGASPQELHASWARDKVKDGWVYGLVKDADAKTHPCLVPYEDLPKVQKDKDFLFSATVKTLAVALNLE